MDFIENLSPTDTPLYNNLGQIGVNAGFVEWQTDTLSAAAANAWVEGAAATDVACSVPSRASAIVQNFQKHFNHDSKRKSTGVEFPFIGRRLAA